MQCPGRISERGRFQLVYSLKLCVIARDLHVTSDPPVKRAYGD